jgi:hypothetical protein
LKTNPSPKAPSRSSRNLELVEFLNQLVKNDSYLVDPASSHMLVTKTKPCMSKYKLIIR